MRESPPTRHWLEILYHYLILPRHIANGSLPASKLDFTSFGFGNLSTNEINTGFKDTTGDFIYSRTFSGAVTQSVDNRNTVTIIASGVKSIVRSCGMVSDGTSYANIGQVWMGPTGSIFLNSFVLLSSSGAVIFNSWCSSSRTSAPYIVTVEYTKT